MRPEADTAPMILGFDTSAAHCAAALLSGDRILSARAETMDKGQAERLMPLLEEVLAEAGVAWRDLAALGVGVGPGNFTGIRIAVSAARGLALALKIPAIGVSSFEALADGHDGPVTALVDARRGAVYAQRLPGGTPALMPREDALEQAQGSRVAEATDPRTLATAIARIAAARRDAPQPRPAPLYLRGADAAPPSDPPPVILP
ncbi:peptidase M22 [Defluviimonas sp. 20V17]|uniref:tRNA N6-adenosine(37)-N6-threonylcarbamoyltransferase complex dimerization subunit TsaB n=1 Tax=Allgaiera indica TaxID=765699 RepID=A0AAN4UPQ1_9RHOB|nr:tRNA (adenosine(37)-N6)-threonylcarbamoyltransferase complex dimerization subunit type 1 TsaB [Allgaiera indica]KDB04290.1 peptidase M22 [Defluviimonas sp. 20V17]GHD99589.1 tRNA N6-adenosine(37)-N6-threonylcarbamoyltransferase complex dimerization subunit TsaB [Allgaiera indica]SDW22387.1 tRNA threonylcarbamoyl adenosine modification protein YeaZ [Allgaiera indica]